MKKYPNATEIVWCQDEPQNQGAWFFVQHYIHENMLDGQKLGYAGRPASASPAVGYAHLHQEQQRRCWTRPSAKLKGFVLDQIRQGRRTRSAVPRNNVGRVAASGRATAGRGPQSSKEPEIHGNR